MLQSRRPMTTPQMLAAVDLGSNSFRMVIARVVGEDLLAIDRLREGVRLAAYLDRSRRLRREGVDRALEALERFGQRVRDFPRGSVRAVGTNTLRQAKNADRLIARAERALGHPIEVISGQEEARLIFLGVSHSAAGGGERRLVVDIGGGSTEVILGEAFEPLHAESLYMGCVGFTERYFPAGRIDEAGLRAAAVAARLELRAIEKRYRDLGWEACLGASGTVESIGAILRENAWSDRDITGPGLDRLRQALVAAGHVDRLELPGLGRERARVLPGGLAILVAIFEGLRVERMAVASGALREGVLYELLGRIRHEDVRDRTIQRLREQYHVDAAQAARVEATALALLAQVEKRWALDPERARTVLSWAARLHEIGLAVAHGGYHKHGAYLLAHSHMPGFSFQDQQILSLLVRSHRRKPPLDLFATLPAERRHRAQRLAVLFRLACLLNRSRSRRPLPAIGLRVKENSLRLLFPAPWLADHPLSRADLEHEAGYLAAFGFKLKVEELAPD